MSASKKNQLTSCRYEGKASKIVGTALSVNTTLVMDRMIISGLKWAEHILEYLVGVQLSLLTDFIHCSFLFSFSGNLRKIKYNSKHQFYSD